MEEGILLNKKRLLLVIAILLSIFLASCGTSEGKHLEDKGVTTKQTNEKNKLENEEDLPITISDHELEGLIDSARKAFYDTNCNHNEINAKNLTPYFSNKFIDAFIDDDSTIDICLHEQPHKKPFRADFQIDSFQEKKVELTFIERIDEITEVEFKKYHYTFVKENNNWVIDDIVSQEGDSNYDSSISAEINKQFFDERYHNLDEFHLIRLFDTKVPQALTIQEENGHSVVRVFDFETKTSKWNKIFEDKEHDSYDGLERLRTFDAAPLINGSEKEQVIIGLQTGSGANLSYYILGTKNNKLTKILDTMDNSLTESFVEIDGNEIVITTDGIETYRFTIDHNGQATFSLGNYEFGFPAQPVNTLNYINKDYDFSFKLPDSWKNKYFVRKASTNGVWVSAPSAVYTFGIVIDGKFVDNAFRLAVVENLDKDTLNNYYKDSSGFEQILGYDNGTALIASFPGQMVDILYEEQYRELSLEFSDLVRDAQAKIEDTVKFK